VREASQRSSARVPANTIRTRDGFATAFVRMLDPVSTAPQKKSVAEVPSEPPAGTA
jgi:hypothetical protein